MKLDKKSLLLYAVTDRTWLNGNTLAQQVEQTLAGGAAFIQLREKHLNYDDFLKEAFELKALCKKYNVPFVINDNIKIAAQCGADGVHVGQNDINCSEARRILGEDKIIGVSVQNVEQALKAEKENADYIGVGAVFPTGTKNDADSVSLQTLREICSAVKIPVIAIGGIKLGKIHLLKDSGICGVAVVSAIFASKDIKSATEMLLKECHKIF